MKGHKDKQRRGAKFNNRIEWRAKLNHWSAPSTLVLVPNRSLEVLGLVASKKVMTLWDAKDLDTEPIPLAGGNNKSHEYLWDSCDIPRPSKPWTEVIGSELFFATKPLIINFAILANYISEQDEEYIEVKTIDKYQPIVGISTLYLDYIVELLQKCDDAGVVTAIERVLDETLDVYNPLGRVYKDYRMWVAQTKPLGTTKKVSTEWKLQKVEEFPYLPSPLPKPPSRSPSRSKSRWRRSGSRSFSRLTSPEKSPKKAEEKSEGESYENLLHRISTLETEMKSRFYWVWKYLEAFTAQMGKNKANNLPADKFFPVKLDFGPRQRSVKLRDARLWDALHQIGTHRERKAVDRWFGDDWEGKVQPTTQEEEEEEEVPEKEQVAEKEEDEDADEDEEQQQDTAAPPDMPAEEPPAFPPRTTRSVAKKTIQVRIKKKSKN